MKRKEKILMVNINGLFIMFVYVKLNDFFFNYHEMPSDESDYKKLKNANSHELCAIFKTIHILNFCFLLSI